jgi:hypothetical protein
MKSVITGKQCEFLKFSPDLLKDMRKFGNSHRRSNAVWSAGAGRNGSAFLSLMVFFILTKLNLDEGRRKKTLAILLSRDCL